MKTAQLLLVALFYGLTLASPAIGTERGMLDGYVGCSYSNDCYPFDLQTYDVGLAIDISPEGNYPYDAVMNFDGSEVWICGATGDGVTVIDRATDTVSHRIPVGEYLVGLCFGQDGSFALASSRDENRIYRISTETYSVLDYLQLTVHPGNLALDPTSGRIYAVEWYGDLLHEISADGTTLLRSVPIGSSLWQLVVDPAGQYIYMTDRGVDRVHVIDPLTLNPVASVHVGDDPWGLDITADGSRLVCVCEDNVAVYLIDFGTWDTHILPLGTTPDPRDVDILDSANLAFVCGGDTGSPDLVFVIDLIDDVILTSFGIPGGSNTNVIAVQPQMHEGPGAAPEIAGARTRLHLAVQPNPLIAPGRICFRLPAGGDIDLAIFDVGGRRLATLASGPYAAGDHSIDWNRSKLARTAPKGTFWLRLRASGASRAVRAIRLD
jgi:YVTN family beta-propeller protein